LGAFHEHVNMAQYGLIVICGGEFADGLTDREGHGFQKFHQLKGRVG
jgi:hypothetical protein